jgi:hypothetical protein
MRRQLPWICGCHDPAVFGHLTPCVIWETQPRAWGSLWGTPAVPR